MIGFRRRSSRRCDTSRSASRSNQPAADRFLGKRKGLAAPASANPLVVAGCGNPQPLAGKQVTRLPLRGNGLSPSSPDRPFVAPTGGTSRSTRPWATLAPLSSRPYRRGRSLPLPPPQAIVGPRPQLKERVAMARPRSAIDAGGGEPRRPGIHLDWVTGQRQRRHVYETALERALRHPAVWQGGLNKRASHTPSATRSRRISSKAATTSARSRSCWGTATSAHHDLHARPEPQARHRPEHGRSDVRPMSHLAALRGRCSGIDCSALQPIGSGEGCSEHGQRRPRKGRALFDAVARRPVDGQGLAGVALSCRAAYPVAEL